MTVEIPELSELRDEVAELKKLVLLLANNAGGKKTVNVADIASMEGVSVGTLHGSAQYLLPRFGQSAYPDGCARWDLEEYLKWRKQSPELRKQSFMQLKKSETRRYAEERDRVIEARVQRARARA